MTTLIVLWALVFQILCLAYLPSLKGPFVYDDLEAIVSNPDLRFPWQPWRLLRDHETSIWFDRRPVAGLVTLVDFHLWGLNPFGYKMTNLLIHFFCGISVSALLGEVARKSGSALGRTFGLLAALLWLFHPLQTAATSFIFQRSEMLMALFFILSLYGFLRSEGNARSPWLWAGVASAFLSALSKEVGLTLVVVLPALVRLLMLDSWKKVFVGFGKPLAVVVLGYLAIIVWIMSGARMLELEVQDSSLTHPWNYFKYQGPVLFRYLKLIVYPYPLVFVPDYRKVPSFVEFLPFLALFTAVAGGIVAVGKRRPWALLALIAFLAVLAPTTSFYPIPLEPEIDFRMYLPSIFVIAGLIAWAGIWALRQPLSPVVALGILVMTLVAEVAVSRVRNQDYRSTVALWEDTVSKAPLNGKNWNNLGTALLEAKEFRKARVCAERMVSLGSRAQSETTVLLGERLRAVLEIEEGRPQTAIPVLEKILQKDAGIPGIHLSLASAHQAAGNPRKALEVLLMKYPGPDLSDVGVGRAFLKIYRALDQHREAKAMELHLAGLLPGATPDEISGAPSSTSGARNIPGLSNQKSPGAVIPENRLRDEK